MMTDMHITPESENTEELQYHELPTETSGDNEVGQIQQIEDRSELLTLLRQKLELPLEEIKKEEVDAIKQQFYKLRKKEQEVALESHVAEGNDPTSFTPEEDQLEEQLRSLLLLYKEHRQLAIAERERTLQSNLHKKKEILAEMRGVVEDTDHINKHYNHFQDISTQFKEIKEVPASETAELWKDFQQVTEQFYDLLKINKELRDYDFKKNQDHKEALCREAEALETVTDVVSAFHRLQELHEDWRQTGPVAPHDRDALWTRFKNASGVINKKHQAYFEEKKAREFANEQAKEALCEKIEAIEIDKIDQATKWEELTKYVLELQQEWKTLGFASKKMNVSLFERFRKSCDDFFNQKAVFFKDLKGQYSHNLQRKEELCAMAEQNKDRTDWKKAVDFFVNIQQQWKEVGPVQHKYSDAVWNRFKAACDYFFNQKNAATKGQRNTEHENLDKKHQIIAELKALTQEDKAKNVHDQVMGLMDQWKQVGHVPFREKDKIFKQYQAVLDELFARKNKQGRKQQVDSFEVDIEQLGTDEQSKKRVLRERERLMRQYDQLKGSLKTYENNMGFLTSSSKGANALVVELERKLDHIKDQMQVVVDKINLIDKKFNL